jgi:hypothetical protein
MPHEIIGTAQCRLCKAKFQGPSAVIVGNGPNQHLSNFLLKITDHWTVCHKQEDEFLQIQAGEFLGLRRMMQFKTTDPALNRQKEELRWRIHQNTRNVSVTDESLRGIAAAIAAKIVTDARLNLDGPSSFENSVAEILLPYLKEMRDTYEEPGKFKLHGPQVEAFTV